ncbi:aminopeptidase family protein P [Holdemania massiliensis]|uniref:aminopeptidase family protein P n=1 Tax=Holdemania massiliensis TaxID=1468449 RepID=UPI001FCB1630|nr:aminopeptidase family protein P [Holdemania massiliensis]
MAAWSARHWGVNWKRPWQKKQARIVNEDLVDLIWKDRPALSEAQAVLLDERYSGQSTTEKLTEIRAIMKAEGAQVLLISALDDIAWLFNLRGTDVQYNPVVLAYGWLTQDQAVLYLDTRKLSDPDKLQLQKQNIEIRAYETFYLDVAELKDQNVWADPQKLNDAIIRAIPQSCNRIEKTSPISLKKAIKNSIEIENLRASHLKDGIAVTKLMYWLKTRVGKEAMSECSIQEKLHQLRAQQEGFLEESFGTICAYKANAAMMHYSADPEQDVPVEADGLLLIDSGGQYWEGTTDITRTFALGPISSEIKKVYTTVLQGMLNLSEARFLYGCSGINLDILARGPVWQLNLDYQCGTGHGVGYLLNVHEGPHGIRWKRTAALSEMQQLEAGMVVTDEPGVYVEGQYGIRIENELIVKLGEKNFYGQFMEFETTTLAPIDLDAVDPEILTPSAREALNRYHQRVRKALTPYLTTEEAAWLKDAARSI